MPIENIKPLVGDEVRRCVLLGEKSHGDRSESGVIRTGVVGLINAGLEPRQVQAALVTNSHDFGRALANRAEKRGGTATPMKELVALQTFIEDAA